MLCAIPGRATNDLQLLRIVLRMIAGGDSVVPDNLKNMVVAVVGEARELSKNPGYTSALHHPESVELALEMRSTRDLADSLSEITSTETLGPALANRLLSLMESHPA